MLYFKNNIEQRNYKEITDQEVKSFLIDIKNNFKETSIANNSNTNENIHKKNKKILIDLLKKYFNIQHTKNFLIEKLYLHLFENLQHISFSEKDDFLDFDITNVKEFLDKLNKLENLHQEKLEKTIESIQKDIIEGINNQLSDNEKKEIFNEIKNYVGEIQNIKDVNISQIVIQGMGSYHTLLTLVIEANGKKVNLDILKNKKTGNIVEKFPTKATNELNKSNAPSFVIKKVYDNPEAGIKMDLNYEVDYSNFEYNGGNIEVSETINNIKDKEKELKIALQVLEAWNGIFKKNNKELSEAKTEENRKRIIYTNAGLIADIFADNASLQGTKEDDNRSLFEWIKGYFIDFLEGSPVMKLSKINKLDLLEDGLLFMQGDYIFEVDDEKGGRKDKQANFAFYFEKNPKTGKWGIKRLKSTFGKTEDNLKD